MPDTFKAFDTDPVEPIIDATLVTEVGDAPGNSTTPYVMAVGDIFQGTISASGDDDWVSISLTAGQTYTISLTGQGLSNGLSDPLVRVYDTNGTTLLFSNDDGGSGVNSLLSFTPTTTGTYYISAEAFGSNTGDFALTVTEPNTDTSFEALTYYLTDGYWEDSSRNTHAFDTSSSNQITVDITGLTAAGQQLARWAFEAWENIANLDFVEVGSGGQITFTDDGAGNSAGASFVASGTTTTSSSINITQGWLTTYGTTIGSYSLQTYIHELGHSLGLGHLGNYNGSATYGVDNTFRNDSWAMSVMSYFDQTDNTTISNTYGRLVGAGIVDVAAIQNLYGASTGGNSAGNSTWGYNSNVGGYMATLFADMLEGTTSASVSGGPVAVTIHDIGGTDTLDFSGDTFGITLNLNPGTMSAIHLLAGGALIPTGNLTIAHGTVIENAIGGSGHDAITGNSVDNDLTGGNGNDTLLGEAGADSLLGDAGADSLLGGTGADTLRGGADNDTLYGNTSTDVLYGEGGDDSLQGGDGVDQLFGGTGNDYLIGHKGWDSLFGEDGADELRGSSGADSLDGGGGNDSLHGGTGTDTLQGRDDDDILYGNQGADEMFGGAGADELFGGSGGDNLNGGDGDDTLWGNEGSDDMFGNDDDDLLYGGTGDDNLRGGDGNDTIYGNQGVDTLNGGTGDDWLRGGTLADTFVFGAGNDWVDDFSTAEDTLQLDDSLWTGTLTAQQVLDQFGGISGGNYVLNFGGGNTLTFNGAINTTELVDDIVFV